MRSFDPRLEAAVAVVEASDWERLQLWMRNDSFRGLRDTVKWGEDSTMLQHDIAELKVVKGNPKEGREEGILLAVFTERFPVTVQVTFDKLNGKVVAFWNVSSQLADFKLAKSWMTANTPNCKVYCDAANFHNAMTVIRA